MLRPFTGHTKEGIRIGASHAAVVSAYGNPPTTKSIQELESMKYDSLGMHFDLKNDKLLMITVIFKP